MPKFSSWMKKSPESTIFDFLRKSSRSKLLSISLKKTQKSCYKGQFQISFNLFEHAISNSDLNLSPEWKILAKIGQKWPSKWSISADFHYYGQGTSMYVLEMDEYQLFLGENIHTEHFLTQLMVKSAWISSKILKIGQNQQKILMYLTLTLIWRRRKIFGVWRPCGIERTQLEEDNIKKWKKS